MSLLRLCNLAREHKLCLISSGNASCIVRDDIIEITGSGIWISNFMESQSVRVNIETGDFEKGKYKPSSETPSHLEIYRRRRDVGAVLHFQSEFATIIACRRELPKKFDVIPEIPYYIGKIGWVPFIVPGKEELANCVGNEAESSNLVILRNHGIFTYGRNVEEVIQRAVFFELACKIIVSNGLDCQYIPAKYAGELKTMYSSKK